MNRGSAKSTAVLVAAWSVLVVGGLSVLWSYHSAPGRPGDPPPAWPEQSRLARIADAPTLVMWVHPQCPCSRASVHELARLMARAPRTLRAFVLAWRPDDASDGWERTDLWSSAEEIPNVTVVADEAGREATLFGAHTSGQTALYDRSGRLRFAGGITPSRGHHGDSRGQSAILAILRSQPSEQRASVYGCGLDTDPSDSIGDGER